MVSAYEPVVELVPQVQSYDWGKLGRHGSKVAEYAKQSQSFQYDPDKPYAELWMGTHPSLPSKIVGSSELLAEYISRDPSKILGNSVSDRYKGDLPFLFKVLAIGKALSIQAHPDKTLAARLHRDQPEIYRDSNHKPEMAIAITPFSGFCGFRPLKEISNYLETVPEFAALIDPQTTQQFLKAIPTKSSDPAILSSNDQNQAAVRENQKLLKRMFSELMAAPRELVEQQCKQLVGRLKSQGGLDKPFGTEEELILRLNDQFPNDIGIFCVFVLNVVYLKPGEAAFLKANEPHAYLTGDIVECMASSDNVVRAGLTPKLRDVPTLTEMLTYSYGPAASQLMKPVSFKSCKYATLYDPPIDEFSVLLTSLPKDAIEEHPPIAGPSILIVTEGSGQITIGDNIVLAKSHGQIFFIAAGASVKLLASSSGFVTYRAFVEVSRISPQ